MNETELDWKRLHTFLTVGKCGSFTGAGRQLGLSQSAISRQISILETELKVSLFLRTTRGLVLTEAGEDLLTSVDSMACKLSMGVARINEWREKPEGPLRVTTSVAFGSAWLSSRMNIFHSLYPDIAVSLLLVDNSELDLLDRQADCALRFGRQTQPTLVQRKLMTVRYRVFASKQYIAEYGHPETVEDLDNHEIIAFGHDLPRPITNMNWLLRVGMPPDRTRSPVLAVNSVYGIYRAVESGLGIAALPYYIVEESSDMIEVLTEFKGQSFDVYFVYPEELKHSKRIQALRDFLVDQCKKASRKRVTKLREASSA